jgi:hypothetical protein
MGRKNPPCVGQSVANEQLYDVNDLPVRLGDRKGHWLVLALTERETGDDTGMDAFMRSIPQMGPGLTYTPGNQMFDLARVQKALPEVDIMPVFIDPGLRYFRKYGLAKPEAPQGRHHPAPSEGEEDEDLKGTAPIDPNKLPMIGKQPGAQPPAEPIALQFKNVVRTHEMFMPGALANPKVKVPTLWVIDPTGVVRLEYELGACDRALYAAIRDLEKGGNGKVDPEILPLAAYGLDEPWLETTLYYVLLALGVLYYPMALLMGTIFTSGTAAFNYAGGLGSILKTSKDYSFLLMLVGVVSLAAELLGDGLSIGLRNHAPWLVAIGLSVWAKAWLAFFAALVTSVGIGRFYVRNERALGWLDPAADAAAVPVPDANEWKPPVPVSDANEWKRPAAEARPEGPTFGPPPGSLPPPREAPAVDANPLSKALAALNSIPRQVEIGLIVAGIAIALLGVRSFGQHWTFDAACADILKKSARMQVPVRAEILSALAKEGFAVSEVELQVVVFQTLDKDGAVKTSTTYVNVASPTSGFYHRHEAGGRPMAQVDYTTDPSSVWPAPTARDHVRLYVILGGFALAGLFAAKSFLMSSQ